MVLPHLPPGEWNRIFARLAVGWCIVASGLIYGALWAFFKEDRGTSWCSFPSCWLANISTRSRGPVYCNRQDLESIRCKVAWEPSNCKLQHEVKFAV
jgi:hypothetical protein